MQILLSADYETPKDLVSRLPLLTEEDEDDLDLEEDEDEDEDDMTVTGSSSPDISLLTGVTSLASIDGAVRRSQMRAGMRGRRGRQGSRNAATTSAGTTLSSSATEGVSLRSGDNNRRELFLEVSYSDPRDSKLYTEPGADPAADGLIYKLYVGGKFGGGGRGGGGGEHYYYCRPYGHVYQSVEVKGEAATAADKSGG